MPSSSTNPVRLKLIFLVVGAWSIGLLCGILLMGLREESQKTSYERNISIRIAKIADEFQAGALARGDAHAVRSLRALSRQHTLPELASASESALSELHKLAGSDPTSLNAAVATELGELSPARNGE